MQAQICTYSFFLDWLIMAAIGNSEGAIWSILALGACRNNQCIHILVGMLMQQAVNYSWPSLTVPAMPQKQFAPNCLPSEWSVVFVIFCLCFWSYYNIIACLHSLPSTSVQQMRPRIMLQKQIDSCYDHAQTSPGIMPWAPKLTEINIFLYNNATLNNLK